MNSKQITIKTGPHKGAWVLTHASGFGSDGASAQYRRVGKNGEALKGFAGGRNALNLTSSQVTQVVAA